MNYLELIRINMSLEEFTTIYTNLHDSIRSNVLPRGAVLILQPLCVNKCKIYHELIRIEMS
jgi:hypothetical protein